MMVNCEVFTTTFNIVSYNLDAAHTTFTVVNARIGGPNLTFSPLELLLGCSYADHALESYPETFSSI